MKDTIIKSTEKTGNFTIMLNDVFKRDDLSARAKGIYGYLMTLPNGWKLHKTELYEHFTEGRDALDKAFKELMEAGYITQKVVREKGKFVSFEYTIYEETISGKPLTGKPLTGKPFTENPHLLNTDQVNNDVLNTNNNVPKKEKPLDDEAYTLASLLSELHIKNIDPGSKPLTGKQKKLWAGDIEKLHRLDGRSYQEIERAIRWVKTHGQFWASVILSGSKLREKFQTVWAQMHTCTSKSQDLKVNSRTSFMDF